MSCCWPCPPDQQQDRAEPLHHSQGRDHTRVPVIGCAAWRNIGREGRMLRAVRIERFKSIEDVTLPLGRMTVLIGPNNSGKSSLLQAIQFGVSIVQSTFLDGASWGRRDYVSSTLSTQQLVYSPLRDVHALARDGTLRQSAETAIGIRFDTDEASTDIQVSRGKNRNIAVRISGKTLGESLREVETPYSAISPGLAGIPSYEEYKSPGMVRRAAARGDANNVLRNVLWMLKQDDSAWQRFCEHLGTVFQDTAVDVHFDPDADETITATILRDGLHLPIDSSGTGVLQTIQVLAYVGLYRPRLLILDEPDSHLHPDNQRKLARYLSRVAEADDFQVLLATHSRHLLDEMHALGADVHWISKGALKEGDFDVAEALLNLGALDAGDRLRAGVTSVVVLTEDSKTDALRAILEASGFSDALYQVWSYAGCTAIAAARVLGNFIRSEAPGVRVIVHLDRDYLDGEEVGEREAEILSAGLHPFVTLGTDIESHFLALDHLATVITELSSDELRIVVDAATKDSEERSIKCLVNHRTERNAKLRRAGQETPSAGSLAMEAPRVYSLEPERWRHGKQTLKNLRRRLQEQYGINRRIEVPTSALRVDTLAALIVDGHRGVGTENSLPPVSLDMTTSPALVEDAEG